MRCPLALYERENGKSNRPLLDMPIFENIVLPKATRGRDEICNCFICLTGRYKGHTKVIKGKGNVRSKSLDVNKESGLYGACSVSNLPKKECHMTPTKMFITNALMK